jgi:anaerobic selenocysteine-containing dehydrogenase
MVVTVDEAEQIVAIRPDREDLITRGFVCYKGLQAPEAHRAEHRVLHPLKRRTDGTFERIGLEQALDEIAAKLRTVVDRDGPEAVGGYRGSGAGMNASACFLLDGLLHRVRPVDGRDLLGTCLGTCAVTPAGQTIRRPVYTEGVCLR